MKYIFRYTILASFPHPDHTITEQQLGDALKSVDFQFNKYQLGHLEQLSMSCVEKFFTKPHQKVLNIIEEVFLSDENKLVPEFNPKQLESIWEFQKVNVYKTLIHSNSKSSLSLDGIKWSVKNIIMRGNQSLATNSSSNVISRLNFNCLQKTPHISRVDHFKGKLSSDNKPGQPTRQLCVTLSKSGVQNLYNSFVDCQNMLNQILMSE